jgi:hypothetical protein
MEVNVSGEKIALLLSQNTNAFDLFARPAMPPHLV